MINKELNDVSTELSELQEKMTELTQIKKELELKRDSKRNEFERALSKAVKEIFGVELAYIVEGDSWDSEWHLGLGFDSNADYHTFRRGFMPHDYDDDGKMIKRGVMYAWDVEKEGE